MAIEFSANRWQKIRDDARRWWAGKLQRPLIQMVLHGRDPGRPAPALQRVSSDTTAYDLSVSPEQMVERWEYELSGLRFLGDAFPAVLPDFGPGVIAALMGAKPEPGLGTVWFHPSAEEELCAMHFRHGGPNTWLERIKDISRAALQRWEGMVQVGMTDLGGNLDILSTFRPGERLLLDLYDHPDQVKRLTWEAHNVWWQYFEEFNRVLRPTNPGYTAWTQIYSEVPYYILQCDFCYMLGPDMFDEFVKPELAASCQRLGNAFYHLDGPGQLPHLDSLLTIPELKGVQWVPGTGRDDCTHWPEVYRKIRRAGKRIQLWGTMQTLDTLVEQLGTAEGIVLMTWGNISQEQEARAFLRKFGAE